MDDARCGRDQACVQKNHCLIINSEQVVPKHHDTFTESAGYFRARVCSFINGIVNLIMFMSHDGI